MNHNANDTTTADPFEVRLRRDLNGIAASTPTGQRNRFDPALGTLALAERPPRHNASYLLAAAAVAALTVTGLVAISSRSTPEPAATAPPASATLPATTSAPDSTTSVANDAQTPITVAANNAVIEPTLLTTSNLPSGLILEDGGSTASSGAAEVELVTPDNSASYRILWQAATCIGGSFSSRADALDALAAQQDSPTDEPRDLYVEWCEGPNYFAVYGTGSTTDGLVTLVSTVTAAADSSELTFVPPVGTQYRSELVNRTWSALAYRDGDRSLLIKVTSAISGQIPLSLAQVPDGQTLSVGPFTAYRMGEQPSPQLLLVYDDNTLVFISGDNLTDQELADAAAALQPADPALAPPVSGNCETFGAMCG